jgi:4'-phosphopantetheinyl transferase
MTGSWLLLDASCVPDDDDWLGPEERRVLGTLRFPKRRSEWRLGRFVAKRALASVVGVDHLERIEVFAAEDGAPEASIDGRRIEGSISISHRNDLAACVIGTHGKVGCDLEAVEPRTRRFVEDFFTDRESAVVKGRRDGSRDRRVALTWSAKESTLKALRVGLRRDTRSIEVEIENPESTSPSWHSLRTIISPEGRCFDGWWRQEGHLVLTVVCDPPLNDPPVRLEVCR